VLQTETHQQNGAVTRMSRSCSVKPSQEQRAIGVVHCKKEGMLLQTLCWHCAECAVHHGQNVREEKYHIYVAILLTSLGLQHISSSGESN